MWCSRHEPTTLAALATFSQLVTGNGMDHWKCRPRLQRRNRFSARQAATVPWRNKSAVHVISTNRLPSRKNIRIWLLHTTTLKWNSNFVNKETWRSDAVTLKWALDLTMGRFGRVDNSPGAGCSKKRQTFFQSLCKTKGPGYLVLTDNFPRQKQVDTNLNGSTPGQLHLRCRWKVVATQRLLHTAAHELGRRSTCEFAFLLLLQEIILGFPWFRSFHATDTAGSSHHTLSGFIYLLDSLKLTSPALIQANQIIRASRGPQFVAYIIILCFEKQGPKQKYCCSHKVEHFGTPTAVFFRS